MRRLAPLLALPLAVVLGGCPFDNFGDDEPRACTLLFAAVTLDARDEAGQPVAVEAVSVRRAGGEELVCPAGRDDVRGCVQPFVFSASRTRIAAVHDGVDVSRAGETLTVEATAGARRGIASLVVRNDGCHVEKVSGPSEIVLR